MGIEAGAGSELFIARARIHEVGSFIVGLPLHSFSEFDTEAFLAIQEYTKLYANFSVGDAEGAVDSEPLSASQQAYYDAHPYLLHRPFTVERPEDQRIVHPVVVFDRLPVPLPVDINEILLPLKIQD